MSIVKGVGFAEANIVFSQLPKWPRESEQGQAKEFEYALGAGAQLSLIQLKKLGFDTGYASWFSDDIFSDFCKREYERLGLEYINLANEKITSPINVNSIFKTEWNQTLISYSKHDDVFGYDEKVLYDYLKNAKYIIMRSGVNPNLYRRLKIEGKVLLLDTGWSENLSFATFREYIQIAHYFFPNRREAEKLTGMSNPKDQAKILSTYYKNGIIKLDKEGVLGYMNGEIFTLPILKEFKHVGFTGSGDSFMVGFIYGLHKGFNFKEVVLSGVITRSKLMSTKYSCETSNSVSEMDILLERYQKLIK